MAEDEIVLVSTSTKGDSRSTRVVISTIFLTFFVVLYYNAIIQKSWFIAITSAILPCVAVLSYSSSLRNKFYFSERKIIMTDNKNEYVDEILTDDILAWNHFEKYVGDSEYFNLIIKTENKYFIIDREYHQNYYEMIDFFKKRNFKRDVNLELNSKNDSKTVYSKAENNITLWIFSIFAIVIFIFWLILQMK